MCLLKCFEIKGGLDERGKEIKEVSHSPRISLSLSKKKNRDKLMDENDKETARGQRTITLKCEKEGEI